MKKYTKTEIKRTIENDINKLGTYDAFKNWYQQILVQYYHNVVICQNPSKK